jgi:hypothetical protein
VRDLGHQDDEWAWCLHCERYYQVKNMRFEVEILGGRVIPWLLCAYPDCDGDVMDIFRKWDGKEPPEINKVYPLYP